MVVVLLSGVARSGGQGGLAPCGVLGRRPDWGYGGETPIGRKNEEILEEITILNVKKCIKSLKKLFEFRQYRNNIESINYYIQVDRNFGMKIEDK